MQRILAQFTLRKLLLVVTLCAVTLKLVMWLGLEVLPFLGTAVGVYLFVIGRRRYVFLWLMPSLWAGGTIGSWHHPGDEYGLFFLSLLPCAWLAPFLRFTHLREAYPLLLGAGSLSMLLLGFLLDRLAAARLLWALFYVAASAGLFAWSLLSYPSLQAATAKNGSIWAYAFAAANGGLYLSVLASLAIAAYQSKSSRMRTRPPVSGSSGSC